MAIWKHGTKSSDSGQMWRTVSIALAIPTILALSPLVGYALGNWVGSLVGHSQAGALIGLVLGFASGVMQMVELVRRITGNMNEPRGSDKDDTK